MKMTVLSPSEKVKKYLVTIGELQKYKNTFTTERSLTEIFTEFWDREDIIKRLKLPKVNVEINRKGYDESEKFRSEGNRLYKQRKFDKALLAYNYAVLTGPNQKNASGSRNNINILAYAYASRSALLFEVGRFQESIEDIDRAINCGYSTQKIEKLEERRGKCLLALGQKENAEAKFKELRDRTKASKNNKNSSDIAALESLIQKCSISNGIEPAAEQSENMKSKYHYLFERGQNSLEFIKKTKKENQNQNINMVNGAVRVKYSTEKGRHLVATRDIEPGEVLVAEKAACSILKMNSNIRSYCCSCLRRAPIVLPCSQCSLVAFCSEACLKSDHLHHLECALLPILLEIHADEEVGLVFRTLLNFTMEEIIRELDFITKREMVQKEFDGKEAKFLLQFINNYTIFHKLEGNRDKRNGECFIETTASAIIVVQLLQKVPEFWFSKKTPQPIEQTRDTLLILGSEVMKLILNFQCNIHCIKELRIDPATTVIDAQCNELGYGVFNALSLMNHSCVPNVLHSNWGDSKFMFSIDFIPKGEEILDSYGERYVSHDFETRQKNLMEGFYFSCDCKACSNDWPVFNKLPKQFILKCTICDIPLNSTNATCDSCGKLFRKSNSKKGNKKKDSLEPYDASEVEELLKTSWNKYETSFKELNELKLQFPNIKKIGKYISLMSKYTHLPHMAFIEAQEVLLRSFDVMGSYVLLPLSKQ